MKSTETSYRHAKRIAAQSGSSFTAAFSLLPKAQKKGMLALYAFARITDDLGDATETNDSDEKTTNKRLELLNDWRELTKQALAGPSVENPFPAKEILEKWNGDYRRMIENGVLAMPALVDSIQRFEIPHHLLIELIDGVIVDQTKKRYETIDELKQYCYLVASTVGIACIHIWGFKTPLPREAAIQCGIGFQLTNILRDISEDAARDRIYLPREIWQPLGVTEDDFYTQRPCTGLNRTMDQIAQIAEACYEEGWAIHPQIAPPGQRMFSLIWRTYRSLLESIRHDPETSRRQRTRLSLKQKAKLFAMHRFLSLYKHLPTPVGTPQAIGLSDSSNSDHSSR